MTHDELIGYVQAHKEGRLQVRNTGGDWFTLGGTADVILPVLQGPPENIRLAPEPKMVPLPAALGRVCDARIICVTCGCGMSEANRDSLDATVTCDNSHCQQFGRVWKDPRIMELVEWHRCERPEEAK